MDFQFIHCADIHLDRSLRGLQIDDDAPRHLLTAPRSAFSALVDLAIAESVAFFVIAGDLYDKDWLDYGTGKFFVAECTRLEQAGIPVYVIYGNHDAVQDMTRKLTLPPNVHVFGHRKAQTFVIDSLKVAIHGQSFRVSAVTENLAAGYPDAVPGHINIGVLHTALTGRPPHDEYAPCTLADLDSKSYDAWCLGHVHEFSIESESPWVVFPGNLQGLHVKETGARGALMFKVEGGRIQRPERIYTDVLRWEQIRVDAAGCEDRSDLVLRVRAALADVLAGADGRHVCARVLLEGESELAGELQAQALELREDIVAQAQALSDGQLLIEKVKVNVRRHSGSARPDADALDDLCAHLDAVAGDPLVQELVGRDLEGFLGRLPAEAMAAVKDDSENLLRFAGEKKLEDLARGVLPSLKDRLYSGEAS